MESYLYGSALQPLHRPAPRSTLNLYTKADATGAFVHLELVRQVRMMLSMAFWRSCNPKYAMIGVTSIMPNEGMTRRSGWRIGSLTTNAHRHHGE